MKRREPGKFTGYDNVRLLLEPVCYIKKLEVVADDEERVPEKGEGHSKAPAPPPSPLQPSGTSRGYLGGSSGMDKLRMYMLTPGAKQAARVVCKYTQNIHANTFFNLILLYE